MLGVRARHLLRVGWRARLFYQNRAAIDSRFDSRQPINVRAYSLSPLIIVAILDAFSMALEMFIDDGAPGQGWGAKVRAWRLVEGPAQIL